jgi:hypothetical protein
MIVLPSTGASRYHNYCVDGGTSPENFGSTLVYTKEQLKIRKQCNSLDPLPFKCSYKGRQGVIYRSLQTVKCPEK